MSPTKEAISHRHRHREVVFEPPPPTIRPTARTSTRSRPSCHCHTSYNKCCKKSSNKHHIRKEGPAATRHQADGTELHQGSRCIWPRPHAEVVVKLTPSASKPTMPTHSKEVATNCRGYKEVATRLLPIAIGATTLSCDQETTVDQDQTNDIESSGGDCYGHKEDASGLALPGMGQW